MSDASPSPPLSPRATKILVETSIAGAVTMFVSRGFILLGIPLVLWMAQAIYDKVSSTEATMRALEVAERDNAAQHEMFNRRICDLEVVDFGRSAFCDTIRAPTLNKEKPK